MPGAWFYSKLFRIAAQDAARMVLFASLTLAAFAGVLSGSDTQQKESKFPGVHYTVISQRWLTKEELQAFEDVKGFEVGVRVRLSNDSSHYVQYLAPDYSIAPMGYHWYRQIGSDHWRHLPQSRGREGPPGTEFFGGSNR